MAGSYRHVTNPDGSYRGTDLIENLGDASEAIDEMWQMITYLATKVWAIDDQETVREAIHEAWRFGVPRPPENTADESLCGFDAFWETDD